MNEALAVRSESLGLVAGDILAQMKSQAELYWKSGLCPKKFSNPEQIVITAVHGRALGIPFSIAVVEIHVIDGVPGLSAKMQLALVRERCKGVKIQMVEQTHTRVAFKFKRPEDDDFTTVEYTWDELPEGLKVKANYKNHGLDMLTARCITRMTRTGFSDILAGFGYDPQELLDARDLKEAQQAQGADVVRVPGSIPKREAHQDPSSGPDRAVKVTVAEGEVVNAEELSTQEVPEQGEESEGKPATEPTQETLLGYDEKAIKALKETLDMMTDQNQVSLAYDRFRTKYADDAPTLMEGYSVMQKRIAALKEKK